LREVFFCNKARGRCNRDIFLDNAEGRGMGRDAILYIEYIDWWQ